MSRRPACNSFFSFLFYDRDTGILISGFRTRAAAQCGGKYPPRLRGYLPPSTPESQYSDFHPVLRNPRLREDSEHVPLLHDGTDFSRTDAGFLAPLPDAGTVFCTTSRSQYDRVARARIGEEKESCSVFAPCVHQARAGPRHRSLARPHGSRHPGRSHLLTPLLVSVHQATRLKNHLVPHRSAEEIRMAQRPLF
jgi:hypothetical protein